MCASITSKKRQELNAKLVEAAFKGLHQEVCDLLADGADVDATERHGNSALSEAAVAGHTPTVGVLLRAHADPNLRGEDGRTALHRAAFHGWNPAVDLLLSFGADPDAKDDDGKTPSQIARAWRTREVLDEYDREKHKELREEKDAERAAARPAQEARKSPTGGDLDEKPTKIMIVEEDEDENEQLTTESKFSFAPKKRAVSEEKKAQVTQAEQRKVAAAEELSQMIEEVTPASLTPPKAMIETAEGEIIEKEAEPIVEVRGAGESRLNGQYYLRSAYAERVEFGKIGDDKVMLHWSNWANEWRMNIGDYKKGNTLYRHSKRPGKHEECHGVPFDGWVKWFGLFPAPTIQPLSKDQEKKDQDEESAEVVPTESSEEKPSTPSKGKTTQFLELGSNLRIVECDDGAARRAAAAAAVGGRSADIALSSGKLVETADGLFGSDEVAADANSEATAAAQASAWLQETSGKIKMPPIWPAVLEAKQHAAERFRDGDLATARDLTTAALSAIGFILRKVEMGDACPRDAPQEGSEKDKPVDVVAEDELDSMKGILHSNRALLLLRQVDAEDEEVLQYGRDAVFRLILNDSDEALRRDANNFKASYRRALALFELGELDEALDNATKVVEHYANTSSEPNPEAVALREKVQAAIKEERKMWGQRAPRNWNRAVDSVPVAEVVESQGQGQTTSSLRRVAAPEMPWEKSASAKEKRPIPVVKRDIGPPRNSADVEKALLVTLKNDEGKQIEYVEKHLSSQTAKKIFKRTPLGPDLLAVLIKLLLKLTASSKDKASEILSALGSLPSASTHAAMLDGQELQALRDLVAKLGPDAEKPWKAALDPKVESDDMD